MIYIVDSGEKKQLPLISDTMHTVAASIKSENVLIVVLLNKIDLPNAMEPDFFIKNTKLYDLFKNDLFIHKISAKNGDGMDVIINKLEGYFRVLDKGGIYGNN